MNVKNWIAFTIACVVCFAIGFVTSGLLSGAHLADAQRETKEARRETTELRASLVTTQDQLGNSIEEIQRIKDRVGRSEITAGELVDILESSGTGFDEIDSAFRELANEIRWLIRDLIGDEI